MLKIYLLTTHYVMLLNRHASQKNKNLQTRAGGQRGGLAQPTSRPCKRRRTETPPDSPRATQCSPSAAGLENSTAASDMSDASDASDKSWSRGSSVSDSGSDSESDAGTDSGSGSASESDADGDRAEESASEHDSECSDSSQAASGTDSDSGSSSQSDTETGASEDCRGAPEH